MKADDTARNKRARVKDRVAMEEDEEVGKQVWVGVEGIKIL